MLARCLLIVQCVCVKSCAINVKRKIIPILQIFFFFFAEAADPKYNFSSFEMAMVNSGDDESATRLIPPSYASHQASVASSKAGTAGKYQ